MSESATSRTGKPKESWPFLRFLARARVRKFTSAQLLLALIILVVASPWLESGSMELLESAVVTLILISALAAIGAGRHVFVTAVLLVVTPLVSRWWMHTTDQYLPTGIFLVSSLVFVLFVTVQLLQYVLRATVVDTGVLFTSIAIYLLFGFAWALAYQFVVAVDPTSIAAPDGVELTSFTALYFSYSTLTTVGYGDIVPVSSVARMLAMTESTTGVLYVAVLIARLVSQHASVIRATPDQHK